MKIIFRDPADLRPHAALAALPMLPKDDPEFHRLCDSVMAHGVRDPLKVLPDGRVVDGRHRWAAARAAQLKTVPVIEVPEEDANTIIIESLLLRRHLTPGQRAYLASPLFEAALEEGKRRRVENLKNPSKSPNANSVGIREKSVQDLAEHLGVTRELLRQANELRKFFYADPFKNTPIPFSAKTGNGEMGGEMTLREYFEPAILSDQDPMGLGSALKGIGMKLRELDDAARGKKHAGGKPAETKRQLELFCGAFSDLYNRYDYWANFSAEEKREAGKAMAQSVTQMPDDLVETLYAELRRELKRRKHQPEDEA